jgi:1-acyl-sn-glycerol-3-phosphate acyltransferase
MIRTAIVAVFLTLYTLIVGPFLLIYTAITGNPDVMFRVGVGGVYFISYVVGLRIRIEGQEKVPPGVCFFLANHTSFVDPIGIVWAIPRRISILAKESLFSIPIIGWAFHLARFVPVDRSNREAAIASVRRAAEKMKQGTSFLAYPEGTRSYDGRLLPFKKGVFMMAIEAGATIVPMALAGAQKIAPKKSLRIRPGEVVLRFGDPIDSTKYSMDERDVLSDRVRAAMAALLPEDQRPFDLYPELSEKEETNHSA